MESYRDEEGETIMDYDDIQSDPGSPEPRQDILDDFEDDMGYWDQRERPHNPDYDIDKVGKPRKKLVKKGGSMGKESTISSESLDEDEKTNFGREASESILKKMKKKGKRHNEKGTVKKLGKSEEVNEMWEWVNLEVF